MQALSGRLESLEMFHPPRCPYRHCPLHLAPLPGLLQPYGSYHPKCRPHPVPRFRCSVCRRTFSRQTFRADYRDHRPDLNARLFELIHSGIGLRQCARLLHLSLRCTELKFRKLARHLRRLNLNLRGPLPADAELQLDEFESYEGCRNTRPVSIPMVIESRSRFVIWAEAATIRPRGKMTRARERAIQRDVARFGPRRDTSRRSLERTLRRAAQLLEERASVVLHTDGKSSYVPLALETVGGDERRLQHVRTSSKLPRTAANPLFPINQTEALGRDLLGRLRRESWLASKKRRFLDLALQVFMTYRNYVRRRFNFDVESPAMCLRYLKRRLRPTEALGWRQDWGERSIHPLSASG
jgi:hypothetical protein